MNQSKHIPWILAGLTLLAMGCQETVSSASEKDVDQKSSITQQSSSSSQETIQGTCTPIYMITPADQPNVLVNYNDGIDYCEEVIRAEQCAGNFCLSNEHSFWTVDKSFKPTTTQSSSSGQDSTQGTCTPIYMITPADQPNVLINYNDGIDYCEEVIRAEQCAGNFCTYDENIIWTVDKNFKPTIAIVDSGHFFPESDTPEGDCSNNNCMW